MKKFLTTISAFWLVVLGLTAQHTITLQGVAFSPNNLTIHAGETVQWSNLNGSHNVNGSLATYPGNPEGFTSGNVAPSPWNFSHTFTTPGVYDYRCDPHFSFGMTGQITVLPVSAAPGDVVITEINYNNPGGDTYEFIELYNRSSQTFDLEGWKFETAISFTFPAYTLAPGEYVVVSIDSTSFNPAFGIVSLDWDQGSNNANVLNNTGENIVLVDAAGVMIDSVHYQDTAPWPASPDGFGPSLVLCDVNADNDNPANWAGGSSPTGVVVSNVEILANPGTVASCPTGPVVSLLNSAFTVLENAGSVFVQVAISGGTANATSVELVLNPASTAAVTDYALALPFTVNFPAGVANDTVTVTINLVDDTDIEPTETLVLDLSNPTNGAEIAPTGGQFTLSIQDNDTPLSNALVITGVFDSQPVAGGTWAKGVELQALENISDLSIFGIGSANNGGGSNGVEAVFPSMSLNAGECVWVTNDSLLFVAFFGFSPTLTNGAANINGDDAIELFENNQVIDVFGEISVDGTNQPWEYLDGWAYRKSGTGPDGVIFNVNNWNYSGVGALVGAATNDLAAQPFPVCAYSPEAPITAIANNDNVSTDFDTPVVVNILSNDELPNPLTSLTITSPPANGTVTVNGLNNVTYTPNAGFCGTDVFTYEICDTVDCDDATVMVAIDCPITYPFRTIGSVTSVDASGEPDSLNLTCELRGVVYGIDYQGVNAGGSPLEAVQFYLIDQTGGISVFSNDSYGYTVEEGDSIAVRGEITIFNCLTQISNVDTILFFSAGNSLKAPAITTFLNETFESELVELTNLSLVDPSEWLGNGGSFNVQVTNGAFTNTMRIDNDCELSSMPAPVGPFHARGLGGQFDNTGACDAGYQFFPRYAADIILLNATNDQFLATNISFFPNPVNDFLSIKTDLLLGRVTVTNLFGKVILSVEGSTTGINVAGLESGMYLISFEVEGKQWTSKFVKA